MPLITVIICLFYINANVFFFLFSLYLGYSIWLWWKNTNVRQILRLILIKKKHKLEVFLLINSCLFEIFIFKNYKYSLYVRNVVLCRKKMLIYSVSKVLADNMTFIWKHDFYLEILLKVCIWILRRALAHNHLRNYTI